MKSYIALLRGINVSGQKKIKMADLTQSLKREGFCKVRTYIQSGNVVFASDKNDVEKLQNNMHKVILDDFGFEVPVLILTVEELVQVLKESPYADEPNEKGLYYVLLKTVPDDKLVKTFNQLDFENEDFHVTERCVYLNCKAGFGKAKLNNNFVERKLKVEATTRNLKTMQKLVEMAG
ncbi:DUF1697 domain-containing protein [Flagellimonas onchidii]|uniref:DUF1697 domain-containing protein n=1 Tax=Flagellimonas onchidii TaxID=2562684 RepID=UPI0010A63081|nr:DUF1697 domain-containing protein [Allomuricauda onchidii]